jgi:hypothetical protein
MDINISLVKIGIILAKDKITEKHLKPTTSKGHF